MRRLIRWLPIVCLIGIGCGRSTPVEPESETQGASRVFAVARELDQNRKMKQAIAAYQQVVRNYPNTPEARKAADRINQAQREASQKVAGRNRR
jgi:hypothetical protein